VEMADEIRKLAELRAAGLLSDDEFEEHRRAVLARTLHGTPVEPPRATTSFGAYQLFEWVGEGGMGTVYRGRHRVAAMAARQGGDVAVKLLHPEIVRRDRASARLADEAETLAALDHPNIVKAWDIVEEGGRLALVMEWVPGRSLSELIGRETGPIPWDRARPLVRPLLDAVAYAHRQGVVHRDLKPDNIRVTPDGTVKVLDFGIARLGEGRGHTKTGTGMGTVCYMAPEQYADARGVDARADVYALGMTIYEIVAGRLPWDGTETEFAIQTRKHAGDIPSPTKFYPSIPPWVVAAIMGALVADPAGRIPTADVLARKLASTADTLDRPPPLEPERPASTAPRPMSVVATAAIAAVIAAGGLLAVTVLLAVVVGTAWLASGSALPAVAAVTADGAAGSGLWVTAGDRAFVAAPLALVGDAAAIGVDGKAARVVALDGNTEVAILEADADPSSAPTLAGGGATGLSRETRCGDGQPGAALVIDGVWKGMIVDRGPGTCIVAPVAALAAAAARAVPPSPLDVAAAQRRLDELAGTLVTPLDRRLDTPIAALLPATGIPGLRDLATRALVDTDTPPNGRETFLRQLREQLGDVRHRTLAANLAKIADCGGSAKPACVALATRAEAWDRLSRALGRDLDPAPAIVVQSVLPVRGDPDRAIALLDASAAGPLFEWRVPLTWSAGAWTVDLDAEGPAIPDAALAGVWSATRVQNLTNVSGSAYRSTSDEAVTLTGDARSIGFTEHWRTEDFLTAGGTWDCSNTRRYAYTVQTTGSGARYPRGFLVLDLVEDPNGRSGPKACTDFGFTPNAWGVAAGRDLAVTWFNLTPEGASGQDLWTLKRQP
jgi:hypothetical protein